LQQRKDSAAYTAILDTRLLIRSFLKSVHCLSGISVNIDRTVIKFIFTKRADRETVHVTSCPPITLEESKNGSFRKRISQEESRREALPFEEAEQSVPNLLDRHFRRAKITETTAKRSFS